MSSRESCLPVVLVLVFLVAPVVSSAQNQPSAAKPAALQTDADAQRSIEPSKFKDPFDAYEAGVFDQALQGFVDEQIEHRPALQSDHRGAGDLGHHTTGGGELVSLGQSGQVCVLERRSDAC